MVTSRKQELSPSEVPRVHLKGFLVAAPGTFRCETGVIRVSRPRETDSGHPRPNIYALVPTVPSVPIKKIESFTFLFWQRDRMDTELR
jgi:hypothetical protein